MLICYDSHLLRVVTQWKTAARDALRIIETGREAPAVSCEQCAGHDDKRKLVYWGFVSRTDTLIEEAKKLNLDPRPFQAIADVVNAWNHPYHTDVIPDRDHLRAIFDAAIAALPEIEEGIRRRLARGRLEPVPRPVLMPPPSPSRNGAHPVVMPVAVAPEVPNPPSPPEPDPELIDDRELARRLRGKRAHMQARVVEFMAGKSEAEYEDLSEDLYPDKRPGRPAHPLARGQSDS